VPDAYRGRVFATYGTTITLLLLCSMGLAGLLATPLGPASTLDAAAGLYLGAAALAMLVLRTATSHPVENDRPREVAALTQGEEVASWNG
jgi:hypothetical protein